MWSPEEYRRFGRERDRPFFDLLARVSVACPRLVVDLGCGEGTLTASLAERWPEARVVGVDRSAEMIGAADARPRPLRLSFEQADLASWAPPGSPDLIVANASLHWVEDHAKLLARLVGALAPRGTLAFQVPANYDAPSHTLLMQLRSAPRWAPKLGPSVLRISHVESPAWYIRRLALLGTSVEAWETIYHHVLEGEDPVLAWMSGTTLRPVMAALGESEWADFRAELGALLRKAYARESFGTVFPFRRIFAVATRVDSGAS